MHRTYVPIFFFFSISILEQQWQDVQGLLASLMANSGTCDVMRARAARAAYKACIQLLLRHHQPC